MWVRREEFERLKQRVERMDNNMERMTGNLGKLNRQTETNTNFGKQNSKNIQRLIEHTGADDGYVHFLSFGYDHSAREFKSFNLSEKIDALLQHLGLTERVTLGNKLVPAPKKEAEKK